MGIEILSEVKKKTYNFLLNIKASVRKKFNISTYRFGKVFSVSFEKRAMGLPFEI